ncbi:MAG: hypothetical protein ACRD0Y_08150 [Terriglobales bacterium]
MGAFAAFRVDGQKVPDRQRDYASQQFAQKLFALLGDPPQQAAAEARTAINMDVSLTPPPDAGPAVPLTTAQLQRLAPNFDWHAYWAALGAPGSGAITASPDALRLLNGRILLASMPQWKTYLRWCWLRATAMLLPAPFLTAYFAFTTGHAPPRRAAMCAAAAAAFPAAAFADVPLSESDYFGDTLHLRAWRVRRIWLQAIKPQPPGYGKLGFGALMDGTSARPGPVAQLAEQVTLNH